MAELLELIEWEKLLYKKRYSVVVFTKSDDNALWLAMKPDMEILAEKLYDTVSFAHVDSAQAPVFLNISEWNRYPVMCYFIGTTLVKLVRGLRGYYGLRHDLYDAFGTSLLLDLQKVG